MTLTATVTASGLGAGNPERRRSPSSTAPPASAPVRSPHGGVATFTTGALPVGSRALHAEYEGDASFLPSQGDSAAQLVNKAGSTTAVAALPTPSVVGQTVTLTATVAAVAPGAGTPAGSVTFLDGGTILGPGTLAGGTATLTTSALSGRHPHPARRVRGRRELHDLQRRHDARGERGLDRHHARHERRARASSGRK